MTDESTKKFSNFQYDYDVPNNEYGIVALGGSLNNQNLITAYSNGIFPWYNQDEDIHWWSPDPRCILIPINIHKSKRLLREIRKTAFHVTFNTVFDQVISNCATPRTGQDGTWINKNMIIAYNNLHDTGWCHSIEVWSKNHLIGGLYGIAIDKIFFAESMYSLENNASKYALLTLCHILELNNFKLIDCQVPSQHLFTLGATLVSKKNFITSLKNYCSKKQKFNNWPKGKSSLKDFI